MFIGALNFVSEAYYTWFCDIFSQTDVDNTYKKW